jgi:hypothetical protein
MNSTRLVSTSSKTSMDENGTSENVLLKCLEYEKNNITLANGAIIDKKLGFLEMDNEIDGIVKICKMCDLPKTTEFASILLCKGCVKITYDQSFYHTNIRTVNLIVIPQFLRHVWKIRIEQVQGIMCITNADNIANMYLENDYRTFVVCDKYLYKFMRVLSNQAIHIDRLFLVAFDSLSISNYLYFDFNFLWVCSSNIRYVLTNKENLNNKGFLKELLCDFIKNIPTNISDRFYVNADDASLDAIATRLRNNTTFIKCNKTSSESCLEDMNKDVNLVNSVSFINPQIVENANEAYNILLNKEYLRLGEINEYIRSIMDKDSHNDPKQQRLVQSLYEKQRAIERTIHKVIARLNNAQTCNICFEDLTTTNRTLVRCCRNQFCFNCLNIWLNYNKNCPICKKNIENKSKSQILVSDSWYSRVYSLELCESNTHLQNLNALLRNIIRTNKSSYIVLCHGNNPHIKYIIKQQGYSSASVNGSYINSKIILVNKGAFIQGLSIRNVSDVIFFDKDANQYSTFVMKSVRNTECSIWNFEF